MSTLHLTIPNSIERHLQEMAEMDGVAVDQFVVSAVIEKISALTAEGYLRVRAERADHAAFQTILDRVPLRTPLPGDE
jgi:uncharacterized protein (DUF1778 family)